MKKIVSIIISLVVLSVSLPAMAATGCCKITSQHIGSDSMQTVTLALEKEDCEARKTYLNTVLFDPYKQPSADNKSCVDGSTTTTPEAVGPSTMTAPLLQVSIPGFNGFSDVECDDSAGSPCEIPWLSEYIKAIYNYGLLIIGILAVIMMMIGGFMRITAAGNREQINHGNNYLKGAILGATLAFCSYMILFLVNPNLVIWRPIAVNYIAKIDLEVIDAISDIVDAPTDNLKYPNVKTYDPQKERPSTVSGCDDCVITSLPTKNNKNINKDLNAKLLRVQTGLQWRVTEASPPTSKHQSRCHYNGRCVDIAVFPPTTDCEKVRQLIAAVKAVGLNVFNEYTGCDGEQTKFGSGGHLHVRE